MRDSAAEHPDLEQYFDTPDTGLPEAVREHVESCARCERDLGRLAELRRLTLSLPREIQPTVDLWPGIAERIAEMSAPGTARGMASTRLAGTVPSVLGGRTWWLAAAAVAAVLVAGGSLLPPLGGAREGAPTAVVPAAAGLEPSERDPAAPGLVAFASAEQEYRTVVESLEEELAARRDRLDPATIAVVERNLAIIDSAIVEARQALAADPSSVEMPLLLARIYRKKLEVLQQAVRISARS